MIEKRLTKTRIRAGVWEGVLNAGEARPELVVLHLERPLSGVTVEPVPDRPGVWAVRVPIPAEVLSDGVQTFLIREAGSDQTLAHFTIITGVAMEDDMRAEVDLLRQELDMLKRAFRRHCLETMG
ncbi:hypothetical protein [Pseudotabrizicola algicola]|uniref:Uncharacterized protein n=1 Tax=Pseudotabrizicola algicola TaxID=2709381 RepID=A0A6B3RLS3_9RHOB|nr:hypothetical protein [Pseudotabrizicola algicola]NEX46113.1 hypothetical protein [Pseudotabrizicola algicola]